MSDVDAPIRVIHLVSTLNVGGLEMVVHDLAQHRNRSMFALRVLCLGEPGALAPRLESCGVPVESLGWSGRGRWGVIRRLASRLRALRPAVLHTHNPDPHHAGSVAAWLAGVPVLVHTKHGRNYPDRPRSVRANRVASWLTNRIIAVSHDAAQVAREVERVRPEKVSVIHNGVDLDRFQVQPRPDDGPLHRAIHVARLNPIKDQATLLQATRIVCDAEPEFRLDLVGDGPTRTELEALRDRLNLAGHVRFLGFRDDVHRLLNEADLFVLSSISEGISITLLEAMASGLPVVATAVGGNPEIVVDGQTGRLVPARSPEALAAAILDLTRHPGSARQMGTAGRRRVEDAFDLRGVTAQYEHLYLDLLGKTRGRKTEPAAPLPCRA